MSDNETSVKYKAVANFSRLILSAKAAQKAIRDLRQEEAKLNAQSLTSNGKILKSIQSLTATRKQLITSVQQHAKALNDLQDSQQKFLKTQDQVISKLKDTEKSVSSFTSSSKKASSEVENLADSHAHLSESLADSKEDIEHLEEAVEKEEKATKKSTRTKGTFRRMLISTQRSMDKLANWRPHLTPPFIVLIPVIASLLGLLNPLVAGLGAVGMAAFGLASSLGSALAGAIVGIIPGIATLIGMIAALKIAMSGVGGAFKAYSAMKNSTGGGGGSAKIELTQAEKLARAQEKLAEATQDVAFAEDNLDDARKKYLQRLAELQKAVDRIALSQARAAANAQLAAENYANTLADSSSTLGQKMDAFVQYQDGQNGIQDATEQAQQAQDDLNKALSTGVDQSQEVIMAQRQLTHALWAQRDAQIALQNEQLGLNGAMGGGSSAASEFQKALDKLSPSAKAFVLTVTAWGTSWGKVRKTIQESFFSQFIRDVPKLTKLFGPLERVLSAIAGAAGRVFDKFIRMVSSDSWLKDISDFGGPAATTIETIGDGFLSLFQIFKDISMAAQPFLQDLAEGFKAWADNLATLVGQARKDGSLADWLDRTRKKLEKWWSILSDIASTISNYSAASEDFGNWMTDGLKKITSGWKKNSEEARKAGSPFQQYLQDIKPLLSEFNDLLGAFFGWFHDEATDPKNIKQFTDLLHSLRTELGPALKNFFDTMSKNDLAGKFVTALSKIVELFTAIMEVFSGPAADVFIGVLNGLIDFLKFIMGIPMVGSILTTVATALMTMAAITFVGKFTGLTKLLGLILRVGGKGGGLGKLLSFLTGASKVAGASSAGALGVAGAKGLGKAGVAGAEGMGALGAAGAKGLGKAGGFMKGLGRAFSVLGILSEAGDMLKQTDVLKKFNSGEMTGSEASNAAIGNNFWLSTGSSIVDSIMGWKSGTAQQGLANGLMGAGGGLFDLFGGGNGASDADKRAQKMVKVAKAQKQAIDDLSQSMASLQEKQKNGTLTTKDIMAALKPLSYSYLDQAQILKDSGLSYENYTDRLKKNRKALEDSMIQMGLSKDEAKKLAEQLILIPDKGSYEQTSNLAEIQKAAQDVTAELDNVSRNRDGTITITKKGDFWSAIGDFFTNLFKIPTTGAAFGAAIGGAKPTGSGSSGGGGGGWGAVPAPTQSKPKTKYFARGGTPGFQPQGTDTVPAMLTPGEYILRKSVAEAIGYRNLDALNSGVRGYVELLQGVLQGQQVVQPSPLFGNIYSGAGLGSQGNIPPFPGMNVTPRNFSPSGGAGAAPFIGGDLIIQNPVPEEASTSISKTIRKMAYMSGRSQ